MKCEVLIYAALWKKLHSIRGAGPLLVLCEDFTTVPPYLRASLTLPWAYKRAFKPCSACGECVDRERIRLREELVRGCSFGFPSSESKFYRICKSFWEYYFTGKISTWCESNFKMQIGAGTWRTHCVMVQVWQSNAVQQRHRWKHIFRHPFCSSEFKVAKRSFHFLNLTMFHLKFVPK